MARVIASHLTPEYAARVMAQGDDRWNGAWFYSEEILRGIVPNVSTWRPWVLVNYLGLCDDHAVVFAHNNWHPHIYGWLRAYDDRNVKEEQNEHKLFSAGRTETVEYQGEP